MRVLVTGAAGFIGSNLVQGLNAAGINDVIVVDDLSDGAKYRNLLGGDFAEYLDIEEFYPRFAKDGFGTVEAIFHQGACSDTMETNGKYMMRNNYRYSLDLLEACIRRSTRLIYASSAAVYGDSSMFSERPENEAPKNVYGYSKLTFDNAVRSRALQSDVQVAGFRYFNVFGPREQHKGRMASVAYHHVRQLEERGFVELFGGYDGYDAGEQRRDFVSVEDVVAVNLWFFEHPQVSGIYNLGTGRAESFNALAHAVVNSWSKKRGIEPRSLQQLQDQQVIRYMDFPDALKGKYQSFTQADLSSLRASGCDRQFLSLDNAVARYVDWLDAQA